jgi:hypothetical protein
MSQIFYNNEFHKLCPTTKKSRTHYILEGGKKISINEGELCNFSEKDIIEYENDYWQIMDKPIVQKINNKNIVYYKLRLLVDTNTTTCKSDNNKTVLQPQSLLLRVNKVDTSEILSLSNSVNRYNSTIFYLSVIQLNKSLYTDNTPSKRRWKSDKYDNRYEPQLISLPYAKKIKNTCKISGIKFSELASIIKRNKDSKIQIKYICKNPFSFIQEDWELFRFDNACNIATKYNVLHEISDNIKEHAWINSFVHHTKKFYIEKNKDKMEVDWNNNKYRIYGSVPRSMLSSGILLERIIDNIPCYTTQYLIDFEKKLSDKFITLFYEKSFPLDINISVIEEYIDDFEKESNRFKLNIKQREAVITHFTNRLSIITGFPGTGKSTIVECILYIHCKFGLFKNISICAPTGLAYKNLIDKTRKIIIADEIFTMNESASGTMHKVLFNDCHRIANNQRKKMTNNLSNIHLYKGAEKQNELYDIDDDSDVENIDLFIADESSMINIWMFNRLIDNCIKFNSRLLLIGDINQLPPVGPGKILKSIIDSTLFEDNIVKLDKICRQNNGALLNSICKMADGGIIDNNDFDNNTLYFESSNIFKTNGCLDASKLYTYLDNYSLTVTNSKIVCYNTGDTFPINTNILNNILQNKYNPSGISIQKPTWSKYSFRVGDRIILTTNEIQTDIDYKEQYRVNGDEAEILGLDKDGVHIRYFGSTTHIISINALYICYQLSYSLSVHKSQGSQYDNIIFMIDNIFNIDKRVIFPAISRAKERCFIIGKLDSFIKAQKVLHEKVSIFMKSFIEYDICDKQYEKQIPM